MIPCTYPAVDIGLFPLLDCESLTGHESHFIWRNIPCGYQYICRVNANNYFPRSPRSVLIHAFCMMPHWKWDQFLRRHWLAPSSSFDGHLQCHFHWGLSSPPLRIITSLMHYTTVPCVWDTPRPTVWHVWRSAQPPQTAVSLKVEDNIFITSGHDTTNTPTTNNR